MPGVNWEGFTRALGAGGRTSARRSESHEHTTDQETTHASAGAATLTYSRALPPSGYPDQHQNHLWLDLRGRTALPRSS